MANENLLRHQRLCGRIVGRRVVEELLAAGGSVRVRRRVRKGQALRITVGFGPLKNQHNVPYSHADWAEFFTLCHLTAWHNKVQRVYPPGLRIQIVFDNWTLARANQVDQ